jgi:hypothetical protein
MLPDFTIQDNGAVSQQFQNLGIHSFLQASEYVQHLPYRRNSAPFPLENVLSEQCGVCSTKHALLKQLAMENGHPEIQLILGIYKMNEWNTHGVGPVLKKYGLDYLLEGHTYLKYEGQIFDYTKFNANLRFTDSLVDEISMQPDQIGPWKVEKHKDYLLKWLYESKLIKKYSLEEIWRIREECIAAMFQVN